MTVIEVEEATAQVLRAQAKARNLSLESYLCEIALVSATVKLASAVTVPDLDRLIDSEAGEYPPLPSGFSRAAIYVEHD